MSKAIRILILEDQPADAELVTHELRKAGFEFAAKVVATEQEFLAELRDSPPHLILADYSLPGYNGLSALASAQEQFPATPFIFVSGSMGEEKAIETLHRGATDYVLKQRLARLEPAVRRALREAEERQKREQAEKERQEAEARYRALFEQSPDGIVILDPKTARPLGFNAAAHKQLGYTREEFERLSLADIEANETPEQTRATIDGVQREGKRDFETRQRTREGQFRHVHVTAQAVEVSGRSVYHCVWRDITERKRTELRMRAFSNLGQRLNSAKNAREAGEIIVGVADELFGWDACVFDLYSAAENRISHVLNMDLVDGRRTECKQRYVSSSPRELSKRAIEHGGQLILRDHPGAVRPEGSPFGDISRPSASLMFVPVRHGTEVVGVLSIQSYTSGAYDAYSLEVLQALADYAGGALERLRAQEALAESEANFRSVWERSIDGMRLADNEGRIVAVNEAFCKLVKLPRDKVEGQIISVAYKGQGPNDGIEVYQKRFATGGISPRDTRRVQLWNSDEVDLEISNSFIELGQRGKLLLSIFRDVSERKHAELRIAAFANLGQRLNAAKTAKAAGEIIVGVADELLGWDSCLFDLYSAADNSMSYVLSMDLINGQRTECKRQHSNRLPTGTARQAIEQGGQLILRDHPQAMRPEGVPFGDTSRPSASILFVPIRHGTAVVGILSIQSYTPGAYNAQSLEALQALADYAGGAIERIRAEEALRASEQEFRSLAEAMPQIVWVTRPDGWNTYFNQQWVDYTGLTLEESHGHGWNTPFHPDDRQRAWDAWQRATQYLDPYALEARLRRADGAYRWWLIRGVPVRNASGEVIKWFGTCTDIEDIKRTAAALETSEAELRGIFDTTPFPVALVDVENNNIEFWSRSALTLFGHVAPTAPEWFQVAYPDPDYRREVIARWKPALEEARRSGQAINTGEYRVTCRDGSVRVCELHAAFLPNKLIVTFNDITERKRAEAELQRSHEQYRLAIAAAGAIPYQKAYGTDTYVFIGEGIKELTGYAPDELRSSVWKAMILETVFLGEAAGLPLAEAARRTLTGEIKHWRADHHIRTRSGGIRWISDCSVQVLDAEGKFCGSMGIIQDITQRKELETQLRQAQKMDAVGQLAGGVAHDFNNMLAVIRGNAELLLMDEDQHTPETREGLKHVVAASERAANLTRQLLTFSRKQVMQPQPLLLNEVIANLTKMLQRVISENIDLQCQYATPLPLVQADTGMMEQVILNLVVNARDAMPHGGQLRVATEQVTLDEAHARLNPAARAGEFVCVRVSDTGTGIAPEVLPRIFEPFFTTKEIGKGTGLGLATVYGLVQQHQGWIEVASQVGEGSTFKVFLPAIATSARPAVAAEAGTAIRGGKETILLVEDEHTVRMMTRRVLEGRGYTIWEATSGQEALEVWQNHAGEIALLLTDIIMPGEMTGRDLAEQLWRQRPGLKVIFMSGYSAEILGKGTEFIRRTRSRFLQKPSSSQRLLDTVRQYLDEAEPGQAGQAK